MKLITDLATLAENHSPHQVDRLAYHVGLLESHLRHHILLLEIVDQEVRQLTLELNKEQA